MLILAIAACIAALYALNAFRVDRVNARHRMRHLERVAADRARLLEAARAERDQAIEFATDASITLAMRSHPAGRVNRHLAVVVDQ